MTRLDFLFIPVSRPGTMILCLTYFVAHFVTVAYNATYMINTSTGVFTMLSGKGYIRYQICFAHFEILTTYHIHSSTDQSIVKGVGNSPFYCAESNNGTIPSVLYQSIRHIRPQKVTAIKIILLAL